MSFVAFVWAWGQPVENAMHQHVLLALADIAPIREVFASAPYIAKKIRRSERHVRTALKALEQAQILTIVARPGKTDLIRLNIPKDFKVEVPEDGELEAGKRGRPRKKTPEREAENPGTEEHKPRQSSAQTPARRSDEPSTEPKKEPESEPDSSSARFAALGGDSYGDEDEVDDRTDARKAYDAYNETAERCAWAVAVQLGSSRLKKLEARLEEVGLDGWMRVLQKAEQSDFCMGREQSSGRKPFRLDFDYMVQAAFFTKLLEGRYDNRDGGLGRDGERLRQVAVAQRALSDADDGAWE